MRSIESGDLEEERRLAYVGITRAKRQLYLTHARTRALFGNWDWNLRSRFIDEIPVEFTDRDEEELTGPAAASTWSGGGGAGTSAGEGPRLRWATTWSTRSSGGRGGGLGAGRSVVVRFAGDGSERKLMADYAPLKKRQRRPRLGCRAQWRPGSSTARR